MAEILPWLAVVVLGAVALAALSYRTRDPDSRLYSEIGAQLATRAPERWIAPEFPPGWYMNGLFREHPAGVHLLPALMGRLGFPPLQAAYAANALYQAMCIVMLCGLASTLVEGVEARALGLLIQLLPVAFTYRIRANHEQAVLLCLLVALYGAERARRHPAWTLAMAAGLVGLLLVKGMFVVLGIGACVMWLFARRSAGGSSRLAAIGLAVAVAAVAAAAWSYEYGYRAVTGEPFWAVNLGRQLGAASAARSEAALFDKAANLVWYAARVLWFAFPWSLVLAVWLVLRRRLAMACPPGGARDGLRFTLLFGGLCVLAFSLSDRRADRYIFPVYYAVGSAGTVVGLRAFPRLRAAFERLDPWHPLPAVAVWALTFGLHILGGWIGLPTLKLWPPA